MANSSLAKSLAVPEKMKAWVLGNPDELKLVEKPVPQPGAAEVLVRIDAIAVCATDLEIIHQGPPALIQGGDPFQQEFHPGHEYMGTVVRLGPGVDEFDVGDRITVEIHAGCGRCERCREGMYTACTNYGMNYGDRNKGHRANGFTTDGGFAEYAVNNINTMVHVPDDMSDEEATLVVTAGTAMYGLDVMGGLIAGQTVWVMGPGPIGLMGVGVAKALGAQPVILTGTRDNRLEIGKKLGADHVINVRKEDAVEAVKRITRGKGAHYVLECSGAPNAVNEAARMLNRGGRICLAAFPTSPRWSTSRISCATTYTCSAFAAKARARRTARPLSCSRNASTPSSYTLTRSRSMRCPLRSATRASASMTRSRWSSKSTSDGVPPGRAPGQIQVDRKLEEVMDIANPPRRGLLCALAVITVVIAGGRMGAGALSGQQADRAHGAVPGRHFGRRDCPRAGRGHGRQLNTNIVVVNRPGAGGAIGYKYAAAQSADGHHLVWNSNSISTTYHSGALAFDYKAFEPVAQVQVETPLLVVKADAPWKDLRGFITYAKANPGKLTVGNSGAGSHTHFSSVLMFRAAGAEVIDVPYGAAQVVPSLLGGHVQAVVQLPGALVSHVKAGSLRVLSAMSAKRDPSFPDIATAQEQGVQIAAELWRGIAVPKGTPKAVIARLEDAVRKTVASPEFARSSERLSVTPAFLPASDFGRVIAREDAISRR
jgi:L-iditol 2-dehydrogenase